MRNRSAAMTGVARKLAELDNRDVRRVYRLWAPVYDATFGKFAEAALKQATARANHFDGRLLEVGVGTGLALPHYKRSIKVTGVDLSPDMLKRARQRITKARVGNVEALHEMDAMKLAFADASFDIAVAMYVMTVVPEPVKVLQELARVTKPGGTVLIVNHFSVERGLRAAVEKRLANYADVLGWRSEFPVETLLTDPRLKLVDKRPVRPFGFFTLLEFRRIN
jgi:phosphatidylethanolamine/phosphatidyl-N-methylethanolamine N-methyltransferase